MLDTNSYYPTRIDKLTFFQDINLSNLSQWEEYNNLIANGKYNQANDIIEETTDLFGYFADMFNLLENRIYTTQDYLLNKSISSNISFVFTTNPDSEPTNKEYNTIWI